MIALLKEEESAQLNDLVGRLIMGHRKFVSDTALLERTVDSSRSLRELVGEYNDLRDDLAEHMLVEESELYPELIRQGKFDEFVSEIMQQHHEITAASAKMEMTIRIDNSAEFRKAADELTRILEIHQPAEEEEVFPLVSSDNQSGC